MSGLQRVLNPCSFLGIILLIYKITKFDQSRVRDPTEDDGDDDDDDTTTMTRTMMMMMNDH